MMNKARRLIHRDSAPILSFSGFGAKKHEERRRSEAAVSPSQLPEPPAQQPQTNEVPPLPKFYIKGINRDKAEEILIHQPVGTFLVRDRETATNPGCYTLSLRHKVGLKHHKIETHPATNKIIIAGYERFQFDTLEQLTEFFVRTQKKEISLMPYDPDAVCSGMSKMTIEQPSYEEMDEPEDQEAGEMYLQMDEGCLGAGMPGGYTPYQNGAGPPPLPNRGRREPGTQSYANLSRPKGGTLPRHNAQSINSYENLPEKGAPPISPVSSAPALPPRVPPSSSQGYENMPGKKCSSPRPQPGGYENAPPRHSPKPCRDSYENLPERSSPNPCRNNYQNVPDRLSKGPPLPDRSGSYQNIPDRASPGPPIPERHPKLAPGYENYGNTPTGYENYFSKSPRNSSLPQQATNVRNYQNLPPKVAPRRATTQVNFSAESSLPRKPVPIRRVKTDTARDYNARRQ